MAWRGLHISKASHLSLDKSRIKIRGLEDLEGTGEEGEPLYFPIEDAAWIILDNARSTLSARLVASCMEGGTPIVFSDERHHPCGMALPFHQHHAQTEVSRAQIGLTTPFKKRIWAEIIKAKIANQANNLRMAQCADATILKKMANLVASGDPKNVEARAARLYWGKLFEDFVRSDESDLRNGLLNYGYACVRAAIARAIVAVGFIPSIGLHHDGRLNPFNLADDLIEPFRPIVDWAVIERLQNRDKDQSSLDLDDRREMAAVLTRDIVMDGEQVSLLVASEMVAEQLRRAVSENAPKSLLFPTGW